MLQQLVSRQAILASVLLSETLSYHPKSRKPQHRTSEMIDTFISFFRLSIQIRQKIFQQNIKLKAVIDASERFLTKESCFCLLTSAIPLVFPTCRFRHLRLKQRKLRDYTSEMVDLSKVDIKLVNLHITLGWSQ